LHPWFHTRIEEKALPEVLRDFQIVAMGRKIMRMFGAAKHVHLFKQFTALAQEVEPQKKKKKKKKQFIWISNC
jgi:hypothetical protein